MSSDSNCNIKVKNNSNQQSIGSDGNVTAVMVVSALAPATAKNQSTGGEEATNSSKKAIINNSAVVNA